MKTPRLTARFAALVSLLALPCAAPFAATPPTTPAPNAADRMFAEYFRVETERLASASLAEIKTLRD